MFKQSKEKNINLIYELTSHCMEIPYVDVKSAEYKKMLKNLAEKCRVSYAEGTDIFREVRAVIRGYKGEIADIKDYVEELNKYSNSLCTAGFVMNSYIENYFEKHGETNEINAIFNYSLCIGENTSNFALDNPKFIINLGEKLYV